MMPRTVERDRALVEDDPADVEGDQTADEECAEGDGEGDGSAAAGEVHVRQGIGKREKGLAVAPMHIQRRQAVEVVAGVATSVGAAAAG